jgi:hypothetical protein
VVGVAAGLAFGLGVIGLRQWDVDHPEVSLSFGALVAGAVQLFGVGGDPPLGITDTVPLAWDVARLLAPLATAGAVVAVLLAVGEKRLHQVAARRARNHVLLVGPANRVSGYRAALDADFAVHATTDGHHLSPGVVRADVDPAVDGWGPVGGVGARTIVVATGDDESNLALCASLWSVLEEHPLLEVLVEIDDHETATRLATALVADDPARQIEIICRSDLIVERATEVMAGSVSQDRTFLLAGAGQLVRSVADGLAQQLWAAMQATGGPRRRIALLDDEHRDNDPVAARFADPAVFEMRRCSSLADVLAWEPGPLIALVDLGQPVDTLRVALTVDNDRPGSVVCIPSTETDLPGGLVPLDLGAAAQAGRSAGVWARVALDLWPNLRTEPGPDRLRAALGRIRAAVGALAVSPHWELGASPDSHDGVALLSLAELADLGLDADLRELPLALHRSGLVVRRIDPVQAETSRGVTVEMIDDGLIEEIAQRVHARYLERLTPAEINLPANRPWHELSIQQQAMGRQQARENVVRVFRLGLQIVRSAPDEAKLVRGFDENIVEELAYAEHDRWSRQKYAQGYRYGPERRDDATPKTHPDLLAWGDLSEHVREKDREPIREIIPGLEAVGLFVVRARAASLQLHSDEGS